MFPGELDPELIIDFFRMPRWRIYEENFQRCGSHNSQKPASKNRKNLREILSATSTKIF